MKTQLSSHTLSTLRGQPLHRQILLPKPYLSQLLQPPRSVCALYAWPAQASILLLFSAAQLEVLVLEELKATAIALSSASAQPA